MGESGWRPAIVATNSRSLIFRVNVLDLTEHLIIFETHAI